jgi:GTPase SAR1 family protein
MKKITLIMILLFAISCKNAKQDYTGKYKKAGKDHTYILELKRDSTFVFTQKYFEFNPKCQGKWKFITKDTVVLNCEKEEGFSAQLSTGYMVERERKVRIINSKKIEVDKIVLRKID